MSLTRASYFMINGAPKNAVDYGAAQSKTAAENTAAIQAAIDDSPDGALIIVPKGCQFNLKSIDGSVNEYNLEYWAEDEADAGTGGDGSPPGTNEIIYWSSNWKQSGGGTTDVNEWRFQAPYHPGIILNVRENIPHGGSGSSTAGQSSLVYLKNGFNQFQAQQLHSNDVNTFAISSWEVRLAFPIGSSSFSSAPVANEIIVGDTSGAKGIVLAVTSSTMTVSWLYGTFESGEYVTVAGTKTSTVVLPSAPTSSYSNKPFRLTAPNNTMGIGINSPPERVRDSLLVGGAITLETAQGGGFGIQAARVSLFNNAISPTTGGSFNINASGNLEVRTSNETVIGAFDRGTSFTVTVKDAVSGNSVTPLQNCFYRESAGIVYFSIALVNINTTGLTAGNQIHIVGLPITARNSATPALAVVSAVSVTSTAGNIIGEIPSNSSYMVLWDSTTSGRSALNISAISSGSGDLFISGCYPR